jgi:hypothetical protein
MSDGRHTHTPTHTCPQNDARGIVAAQCAANARRQRAYRTSYCTIASGHRLCARVHVNNLQRYAHLTITLVTSAVSTPRHARTAPIARDCNTTSCARANVSLDTQGSSDHKTNNNTNIKCLRAFSVAAQHHCEHSDRLLLLLAAHTTIKRTRRCTHRASPACRNPLHTHASTHSRRNDAHAHLALAAQQVVRAHARKHQRHRRHYTQRDLITNTQPSSTHLMRIAPTPGAR